MLPSRGSYAAIEQRLSSGAPVHLTAALHIFRA
jgi:hypothetical protein